MIQTTKWHPDTCGCELEYTWDDAVSEDLRIHTHKSIVKCAKHSQADNLVAHTLVLNENQSKNRAIGLAVSTLPKLAGKETEIKWRIEADGSVVLSHPSLVKSELNTLNALAKPEIINKVTFE